jgi:hypothetical protein
MLRMCVYMHSRFVENHPIRILEDGPLISEVVLSQAPPTNLFVAEVVVEEGVCSRLTKVEESRCGRCRWR